jgi:hypothetical protein
MQILVDLAQFCWLKLLKGDRKLFEATHPHPQ